MTLISVKHAGVTRIAHC